MTTFTPSKYQIAIENFVMSDSGNGIVNAVAGSGKTTTLVRIARLITNKTGLFVAFNKHIAVELSERLQGTNFAASTIHAMCLKTLTGAMPKRPQVKFKKWQELAELHSKDVEPDKAYQWQKAFKDLVSKVMVTLTNPSDLTALQTLVDHFDIENTTENMLKRVSPAIQLAEKLAREKGEIDFNEMIYWCVKWNLTPPQYDFVMVDECQDLNAMQLEMVMRCIKPGTGRALFVGDERQAIYGFAGADSESYKTIRAKAKAKDLPLSVNYRCPKSHLALVRDIVPHIEDGPNAIEGTVNYSDEKNLVNLALPGDYVLCRLNAPLVGACINFIKSKKPARVLGRDIAAELCNLLDKIVKGKRYGEISEALEAYKAKEVAKLELKPGSEKRVQSLEDKINCLLICADEFECSTVEQLKAEIDKLFADLEDGKTFKGVTLCTVHKAKGLEADNVFILKPESLPLKWKNQSAWQFEQELNIRYVALTRAKKCLTLLGKLGKIDEPLTVESMSLSLLRELTGPIETPKTALERSLDEVLDTHVSEPEQDDFEPYTPEPEFVEAAKERWDVQTLKSNEPNPYAEEDDDYRIEVEEETAESEIVFTSGDLLTAKPTPNLTPYETIIGLIDELTPDEMDRIMKVLFTKKVNMK